MFLLNNRSESSITDVYLLSAWHADKTGCNDSQHNDTQHTDTQHNDTQNNDTVMYAECRVC
jgi:hypothetical protein